MPPKTGAKVKLAGKQRTLRYTQHSLEALEDERGGEPLLTTVQRAGQLSSRAIRCLLWAGLQHEDPAPSLEDVTAVIEPPYKPLIDGISAALMPWIEPKPTKNGAGPEGNE